MNKKSTLTIILAIIVAFSFGLGGGVLGAKLLIDISPAIQEEVSEVVSSDPVTVKLDLNGDVTIAETIAAKSMPSVVGISTVFTQTYSGFSGFDFFFGGGSGGYSYDTTAVGTGFIVDPSGYILTNSHVVSDGEAKSIVVSLYDGSKVDGKVLWNDSTLDLAVVKIESEDLVAIDLGDSDTINIGSYAAVIGNPLGLQFERSMSQGIISGLNRTITVSDGTSSNATTMEGLIQTDATINSGNSGGPLLNAKGEVIGINSAKASDGEGMGFAIPINIAKPIVEQIKETGRFDRAYLGIGGIGLEEQNQYTTEQLEEYFGTTSGIYISKVYSGGGAANAGLKSGDIITKVAGVQVGTMNKINATLVKYKVGDSVEVEYIREGNTKTCSVVLNSQMLMTEQEMKKN